MTNSRGLRRIRHKRANIAMETRFSFRWAGKVYVISDQRRQRTED